MMILALVLCSIASLLFLTVAIIFWIANSDGQTRKPNGEWS